ncbi:MAG: 3-keto-disaccharide hydrolase [Leadbetterella sp.]
MKIFNLITVCLLMSCVSNAQKFERLFSNDLSNAIYPDGVWSYSKEGVLTATEDKIIWTQKSDLENFHLKLEFKTEKGTNSGVFLYGQMEDWTRNAFEVQIADDFDNHILSTPKNWHCGALFGLKEPLTRAVRPPGEWNLYEIICKGSKIRVVLNDTLVNDVDLSDWKEVNKNPDGSLMPEWIQEPTAKSQKPTRGRIGLQGKHNKVPIYFRNIEIAYLD